MYLNPSRHNAKYEHRGPPNGWDMLLEVKGLHGTLASGSTRGEDTKYQRYYNRPQEVEPPETNRNKQKLPTQQKPNNPSQQDKHYLKATAIAEDHWWKGTWKSFSHPLIQDQERKIVLSTNLEMTKGWLLKIMSFLRFHIDVVAAIHQIFHFLLVSDTRRIGGRQIQFCSDKKGTGHELFIYSYYNDEDQDGNYC